MGALASFTCGAHDAAGGMGLELTGPFPGSIAVGYQTPDGALHRLPLFVPDATSEADRYVGEGGQVGRASEAGVANVEREFLWATDTLRTPEIEFSIATPFGTIPDPDTATAAELKFASCPAVHTSITFKNVSDEAWRGFFGLGIEHRWSLLRHREGGDLVGAMSQDSIGFATRTAGAKTFIDFSLEEAMAEGSVRGDFLLGKMAGVTIEVPAGETVTLEIALGFYRQGKAASLHGSAAGVGLRVGSARSVYDGRG